MAAVVKGALAGRQFVGQVNLSKLVCNSVLKAQAYQRLQRFSTSRIHGEKYFNKVLIANRGEIACRIIKTCRRLGIKTVAVYSEADANAMHSHLADEAVLIGPPPSAQSYLRMDAIIDACKQTGAEAVHPGYGFLSENSVFHDALEANGITFIGPSPFALKAMGDKLESKRIALKASVSTIPGFDGVIKDDDHAVAIAREVGYPVMIKASAGGGGKGMRIANNDTQIREGFRLSSQEAKSSFGDDRLLIEKFIEHPRHIEMQVIGDKHGNVCYLNERECSFKEEIKKLSKKHQAHFWIPGPGKPWEVGYSSAGTVEFLVDKYKNFYFLEMNTRLQVEHPITEYITGLDIVELMLRSAAGHPLPLEQKDVQLNGWALECRVYAEDPYKSFGLPSTGRLFQYIQPDHLENVRCDSGIMEGQEISIYYDSMICKLITYGKTRNDSIESMEKALDSFVIRGVLHNISLLRDILDRPSFLAGNLSTDFLNEEYQDGFKGRMLTFDEKNELVAAACHQYVHRVIRAGEYLNQSRLTSQRNLQSFELVCTIDGEKFECAVEIIDQGIKANINGVDIVFTSHSPKQNTLLEAEVNGVPCVFQKFSRYVGQQFNIIHKGTKFPVIVRTKLQEQLHQHMPEKPEADHTPFLRSPMPGTLREIRCKVGDDVFVGMEVAVVEAMKMQNMLRAEKNGKVRAIYFRAGDSVAEDDLILEIE
eukprot:gene16543-7967_t